MTPGRPSLVLALVAAGLTVAAAARPPRWAAGEAIPLWIESTNVPPEHLDLVRRAVRTWGDASGGALVFRETADFPRTGIRVRFAKEDLIFGEAAPSIDRRTGWIVRADVVLAVDVPGDPLQKRLVLYLTALHELGHAVGLDHTDGFDAIMYRFQRPLDPERYFLRYRKALRTADDIGGERATGLYPEDRRALRRLYGP